MASETNDSIKIKFTTMVEEFKKQCVDMLEETKPALNELMTSADLNFDNMANTYRKGCSDMKNEIARGNFSMVESFRKNTRIMRQNIDDAYKNLAETNLGIFVANVKKFEQQYEHAIAKSPALNSSNHNEVVASLKAKHHQVLETATARHKLVTSLLHDNSEAMAKSITISLADLTMHKK